MELRGPISDRVSLVERSHAEPVVFESDPIATRAGTFSIFAYSTEPISVLVAFSSERGENITRAFDVGPTWQRLVVTLSSSMPLGRTSAVVRLASTFGRAAIALDHPQIEAGSDATSPIIGRDRAADEAAVAIDVPILFTMVVEVDIGWDGTSLATDERRAVIALGHGLEELAITIDGRGRGRVGLINYSVKKETKRALSPFPLLAGIHRFVVTYGRRKARLYCDGMFVAELATKVTPGRGVVHLGRSTRHQAFLNGYIRRFLLYPFQVEESRLALVRWGSLSDDEFANWIGGLHGAPTTLLGEQVKADGPYHAPWRAIGNSLSRLHEHKRKLRTNREDEVRDWLNDTLLGLAHDGWVSDREHYRDGGRTDVILRKPAADGSSLGVIVELKIWGRPGFKELPVQPLKYAGPQDHILVLLVLDPGVNDRSDELFELISSNLGYPYDPSLRVRTLEVDVPQYVLDVSDHTVGTGSSLVVLYYRYGTVEVAPR